MKRLWIVLILALFALPTMGQEEDEDIKAELRELRAELTERRTELELEWLLVELKRLGTSDKSALHLVERVAEEAGDRPLKFRRLRTFDPDNHDLSTPYEDTELSQQIRKARRFYLEKRIGWIRERIDAGEIEKPSPDKMTARQCLFALSDCLDRMEQVYQECLADQAQSWVWCMELYSDLLENICEPIAEECCPHWE